MTGAADNATSAAIGELLQDAPLYEADLQHWIAVGLLRRKVAEHGLNVTIPDAHVAQCAIDLGATLLTRDAVFRRIAAHVTLDVAE